MENCGWDIEWLAATPEFQAEVRAFQAEWEADDPMVWVQTSGSTGKPKPMLVEKERMKASASTTLAFLGLQPGDSALLCLPVKYIAGKMMMVRAWLSRLSLWAVTPSSHPLAGLQQAPVFAAMTPMQVIKSLEVERERVLLRDIRQLIIGGGAIDPSLAAVLREFPHAVWSTYGMTETLSHVALRRLSGPSASDWYQPFQGVHLSLSHEQTLIIEAPAVCAQVLQTNDIAEIHPNGHFRILGRKDNVINSGGVKIQIEQMEEVLRPYFAQPFLMTSVPNPLLGEEVVMLMVQPVSSSITTTTLPCASSLQSADSLQDADVLSTDALLQQIQELCARLLPPYWKPMRLIGVEQLPMTETGKPSRAKAKDLAMRICNENLRERNLAKRKVERKDALK